MNPFQSVQTANHLTEGSFSSYFRSLLQQLWVIFLQYYWILILLQNLWGKSESGFHEGAVLQIRSFTSSMFSLSSVKIWQQCQTLGCPNQLNWMMPIRTPRTNLVWKTLSSLALQNFCRNKVCFCRNKMCFSQKLWNSREMVLVAHAEQHKKTWRKYSEFFDQKVSYLYIFLSFIRKRTFK